MKKTTMLITLLIILFSATGSKAQTMTLANALDTIAAYAPHVPTMARWDSTAGKKFWGFHDIKYNRNSKTDVIAWAGAYHTESHEFHEKLETFVYATDPASLASDAERDIFYDISAIWIIVHANH